MTMVGADHSSGAQLTGFEGVNKYVGEPYAPDTAVFELTPGEPIEMPPRSG